MGGNVALTIRKDGQEYRMDRWTNIMPSLLHDISFLNGEKDALDDALDSWVGMKEDWERNGPDGPFDFNMTPVYAPFPYGLKPSEYGAIVVDFDTNHLLNLQGYCGVGTIDYLRMGYGPRAAEMNPDKEDIVNAMAAAGRIQKYTAWVKNEDALTHLLSIEGATYGPCPVYGYPCVTWPGNTDKNNLLALLDDVTEPGAARYVEHAITRTQVVLDMKPFTLIDYPESAQGYQDMRDKILELGFTLSQDELDGWEERIRYEDEDH
jgi:hypothetical protein